MISGIILYGFAKLLGVRVTSFYRSPEHNKEVGGEPGSLHQYGAAIDCGLETGSGFLNTCSSAGYKVIKESDHYHIQATPLSEWFFRCDSGLGGFIGNEGKVSA